MKNLLLSATMAIIFGSNVQAQSNTICTPVTEPKPLFGVHPQIVFSNAWNNINSNYGEYWGSSNMGSTPTGRACAYLDTDGWPKGDKTHTFRFDVRASNPDFKFEVGQVMKCRFKGLGAQMTSSTGSSAIVQNATEAGGYYNWEFKINSTSTQDAILFSIKGKVTEVQFMLPSYNIGDSRLITDECKNYLNGVKVLRMMGASGCNSNFERKWEHRTPANAPFENTVYNGDNNLIRSNQDNCFDERASNPWLNNTFNQQRSYPWEKAIDVCNYLNMDFYANVPVLADLDYMNQLGKLLKLRLKPTLNVYIEIGNELWNFGGGGAFQGFAMSFAAVHNMVIVQGDKSIDGGQNGIEKETGSYGNGTYWTGGMGAYAAARRWPAYRMKQFMDEFAKTWGFASEGGVGARVRGVLCGQLQYGWGGDYWFIGTGIDFLEKAFGMGTPKKYLHGLGITHYTNINASESLSADQIKAMSVDQIFNGFYASTNAQFAEFGAEGDCRTNASGNCEGNELEDVLRLAKQTGLKVIAYEGGHEGNAGWAPLNNLVAAFNDKRMYEHTMYTMNKWYSSLGHDALFIKNGFFTTEGYGAGYAVAEKLGDQSQQYKAYRTIMDNPSPEISTERGIILGKTVSTSYPANKPASYYYKTLVSGQNNIALNSGYIIKNFTPGRYSFKLKLNSITCTQCKLDVYLNDTLAKANWSFASSAVALTSDSIVFNIPYGIHAITFKNRGDINSIIMANSLEFRLLKSNCVITSITDYSLGFNNHILLAQPNPNEGSFELVNPLATSINISITDAQGRVVGSDFLLPAQQKEINLNNLPKGIYYIRPSTNEVKGTKVIVQ